ISFASRLQARISALVADRFAWLSPWLRPGGSTQALRIPSRDGHPALRAHRCARPPSSARPVVYASPLRGCGGTFTRKRIALLGAQLGGAILVLCAPSRFVEAGAPPRP